MDRWTDMDGHDESNRQFSLRILESLKSFITSSLNLRMVDWMEHVPYTGKTWNAFKIKTVWQQRVIFVLISFFKKLVVKMCR
jgi:hypothetical protein